MNSPIRPVWLVVFAISACSSSDGARARCVAGRAELCSCEDGRAGQQVCGVDGTYGACGCAAKDGGSTADNRCVPGRVEACLCTNGWVGTQACASDGTYGACACSAPPPIDAGVALPRCVPGRSDACLCADGRVGTQACSSDGTYGACACAPPPPPVDAGPPLCVPGRFDVCLCADGRFGEQLCNGAGTYDGCICVEPPADAGVPPPTCVPGRVEACLCADGRVGSQACSLAGRFDACACAPAPSVDAGPDIPLCVPGLVSICVCPDSSFGQQVCSASGAFGDCQCGASAADAGPQPARCVPGRAELCACVDGQSGQQICAADGTYGACACVPASTSGDAGVNAPLCVPGKSDACACASGALGQQICSPDGVYGACTCVSSTADGGGVAPLCVPGKADACVCADARVGQQICGSAGTYGACACPPVDAGAPGPFRQIVVGSPNQLVLTPGESARFGAPHILDADGGQLDSTSTTWQWVVSGDGGVLRAENVGVFTSVSPGVGTVMVSTSAFPSTSPLGLTATVLAPVATGLEIRPGPLSLAVGAAATLRAIPLDQHVRPLAALATASWTATPSGIVSVGVDGRLRGLAVGSADVTVSSDGLASAPVRVTVVAPPPTDTRTLSVTAANDCIYDPFSRRLYVSLKSTAGASGNSVIAVDPETASVTKTLFVGSEPNHLAVSDDGQYLYVGIDGSAGVRRLRLPDLADDLFFNLSMTGESPSAARSLAVLPRAPRRVVVARIDLGFNGSAATLTYEDGIRVGGPPAYPNASFTYGLVAGWEPNVVYGIDNGNYLQRIGVDGMGTFLAAGTLFYYSNYVAELGFAEGVLYHSSGKAVDVQTRQLRGTFALTGSGYYQRANVDSTRRRVYFLAASDSYSTNLILQSFDMDTYLATGSQTVALGGTASYSLSFGPLVRWGANGFAFLARGDTLYLVRSALVP